MGLLILLAALTVTTGRKAEKFAKVTAIKKIIRDTYYESGECKGMETRNVVASIEQGAIDVLTQGYSLDVSKVQIFWWVRNGEVQVRVYKITDVKDSKHGKLTHGKVLVEEWSYPVPSEWKLE